MARYLSVLLLFFAVHSVAKETPKEQSTQSKKIELQTTISGSQEEPKFMSILPWQDLSRVTLPKPKLTIRSRHKITAIDPAKLQRQIAFHTSQNKNNNQ